MAGDALSLAFLSPFTSGAEPPTEVNLSNVSTLNDLRGKVSAIWAASFFHVSLVPPAAGRSNSCNFILKLFSEKDQRQLAHSLGSLLSPESGSILFGSHIALPNKGVLTGKISDRDVSMFCHDLDSWKEMWVGQSTALDNIGGFDAVVFPPDSVKLDSMLKPVKSETGEEFWCLVWSITRV